MVAISCIRFVPQHSVGSTNCYRSIRREDSTSLFPPHLYPRLLVPCRLLFPDYRPDRPPLTSVSLLSTTTLKVVSVSLSPFVGPKREGEWEVQGRHEGEPTYVDLRSTASRPFTSHIQRRRRERTSPSCPSPRSRVVQTCFKVFWNFVPSHRVLLLLLLVTSVSLLYSLPTPHPLCKEGRCSGPVDQNGSSPIRTVCRGSVDTREYVRVCIVCVCGDGSGGGDSVSRGQRDLIRGVSDRREIH